MPIKKELNWFNRKISFKVVILTILTLSGINLSVAMSQSQIINQLVGLVLLHLIPSFWLLVEQILVVGLQCVLVIFYIGLLVQHHQHHFLVWTALLGLISNVLIVVSLAMSLNLTAVQMPIGYLILFGLTMAIPVASQTEN